MTVTPKSKQGAKTHKHSKAEFERVLTELEKQSREFRTTPAQKMVFGLSAAWVSLAPLYLYLSGIYEVDLQSSLPIFLLGACVSGVGLFSLYDTLASKKRHEHLKNNSAVTTMTADLHTYTHTYALATLNLLFSLALTGCVVYVFREYEMGLPVKHLVSVVSALLVCAGLVYGNAL
eukprot:gene25503-30789_t